MTERASFLGILRVGGGFEKEKKKRSRSEKNFILRPDMFTRHSFFFVLFRSLSL